MQTRNARKALPRGTALPEWIVNSKERGGSYHFIIFLIFLGLFAFK